MDNNDRQVIEEFYANNRIGMLHSEVLLELKEILRYRRMNIDYAINPVG